MHGRSCWSVSKLFLARKSRWLCTLESRCFVVTQAKRFGVQVIYRAAGDMLGADLRSVVAVGDSLHHDIGGAAAAGKEVQIIPLHQALLAWLERIHSGIRGPANVNGMSAN